MPQANIGKHHQRIRKRVYQQLGTYPAKDPQKRIIDKLIYIAGILAPILTIPQAWTIWSNKSAADISIVTWSSYLLFSVLWLWYGTVHKEKPIITLELGLVLINAIIVLGILLFS